MPKSRPPYPQEFRDQIAELAKMGRTPSQLAREFCCSAQTITNWIAQAAIDAGKPLAGKDGLNSAERAELTRLRRENPRTVACRWSATSWQTADAGFCVPYG